MDEEINYSEFSNDVISGDKKILNIIGNEKVKILIPNAFKLTKEDEKEFGPIVRRDRALEYKNLLNRIILECGLTEYDEASIFVEEANKIYHHYHILLSYNALCIYALSDISKLTINKRVTNKIVQLLKEAKIQKPDSEKYLEISNNIGKHFYGFINMSLNKIISEAPRSFRTLTIYRQKLYYNAISKHLIQLETCFEIHQDTQYLEDYVNHLSGQKNYAWIHLISKSEEEDFGRLHFQGGTRMKIFELERKIKAYKTDYTLPELLFGNYFEEPVSRKKNLSTIEKRWYLNIWVITFLIFIVFLLPIILKFDVVEYLSFLAASGGVAWIFQPRGQFRMNYLEKVSRYFDKKLFSIFKF